MHNFEEDFHLKKMNCNQKVEDDVIENEDRADMKQN
jgi:hypothetical protein